MSLPPDTPIEHMYTIRQHNDIVVSVIPDWTADGLLPVGVHVADWPELQARYGTNSRRRVLLSGFRDVSMALAVAGCTRLWLDGSFITDKDTPGDYDLCWDWQGVDRL